MTMNKVFDLQRTSDQRFSIEQGSISNHHFCRVTVELVIREWNADGKKCSRITEEVIGEGVARRKHNDDVKIHRAEKKVERAQAMAIKNVKSHFVPTLFQQVFTDGENI
jgi:hypothetical protein